MNRETDEGGYSPVQVDDQGKPRTIDGIDLAWNEWWVAAYARHAVLTDRSSYAFSARLFAIGSALLMGPTDVGSVPQLPIQSRIAALIPFTVSLPALFSTSLPFPHLPLPYYLPLPPGGVPFTISAGVERFHVMPAVSVVYARRVQRVMSGGDARRLGVHNNCVVSRPSFNNVYSQYCGLIRVLASATIF